MEEKIITHEDFKWLANFLKSNEEMKEVSKYLNDNNLTIKVKIYNGNKSPETGYAYRVYLEGVDLSVNGCCFNGSNLLSHIRNYKKYKGISEHSEYKRFLVLRDKYEKTYQYLK